MVPSPGGTGTPSRYFRWDSGEPVPVTVTRAVARHENGRPEELRRLDWPFDPEALDHLLTTLEDVPRPATTAVEFSLGEYRVHLDATGAGRLFDAGPTGSPDAALRPDSSWR